MGQHRPNIKKRVGTGPKDDNVHSNQPIIHFAAERELVTFCMQNEGK
jgi:hypothetical protein